MAEMGRPSKFDTINIDQMQKLFVAGWTDAQVCDFFGICTKTINNWKNENPDFLHSLQDWKSMADKHIEKSLYHRAMGYTAKETKVFQFEGDIVTHDVYKEYPPETVAIKYWLNNRKPKDWKEKVSLSHELSEEVKELVGKYGTGGIEGFRNRLASALGQSN